MHEFAGCQTFLVLLAVLVHTVPSERPDDDGQHSELDVAKASGRVLAQTVRPRQVSDGEQVLLRHDTLQGKSAIMLELNTASATRGSINKATARTTPRLEEHRGVGEWASVGELCKAFNIPDYTNPNSLNPYTFVPIPEDMVESPKPAKISPDIKGGKVSRLVKLFSSGRSSGAPGQAATADNSEEAGGKEAAAVTAAEAKATRGQQPTTQRGWRDHAAKAAAKVRKFFKPESSSESDTGEGTAAQTAGGKLAAEKAAKIEATREQLEAERIERARRAEVLRGVIANKQEHIHAAGESLVQQGGDADAGKAGDDKKTDSEKTIEEILMDPTPPSLVFNCASFSGGEVNQIFMCFLQGGVIVTCTQSAWEYEKHGPDGRDFTITFEHEANFQTPHNFEHELHSKYTVTGTLPAPRGPNRYRLMWNNGFYRDLTWQALELSLHMPSGTELKYEKGQLYSGRDEYWVSTPVWEICSYFDQYTFVSHNKKNLFVEGKPYTLEKLRQNLEENSKADLVFGCEPVHDSKPVLWMAFVQGERIPQSTARVGSFMKDVRDDSFSIKLLVPGSEYTIAGQLPYHEDVDFDIHIDHIIPKPIVSGKLLKLAKPHTSRVVVRAWKVEHTHSLTEGDYIVIGKGTVKEEVAQVKKISSSDEESQQVLEVEAPLQFNHIVGESFSTDLPLVSSTFANGVLAEEKVLPIRRQSGFKDGDYIVLDKGTSREEVSHIASIESTGIQVDRHTHFPHFAGGTAAQVKGLIESSSYSRGMNYINTKNKLDKMNKNKARPTWVHVSKLCSVIGTYESSTEETGKATMPYKFERIGKASDSASAGDQLFFACNSQQLQLCHSTTSQKFKCTGPAEYFIHSDPKKVKKRSNTVDEYPGFEVLFRTSVPEGDSKAKYIVKGKYGLGESFRRMTMSINVISEGEDRLETQYERRLDDTEKWSGPGVSEAVQKLGGPGNYRKGGKSMS